MPDLGETVERIDDDDESTELWNTAERVDNKKQQQQQFLDCVHV